MSTSERSVWPDSARGFSAGGHGSHAAQQLTGRVRIRGLPIPKSGWASKILRCVGFVLLAAILWNLDWERVSGQVLGVKLAWLGVCAALIPPVYLLRTLRWASILRAQRHPVPLRELYQFTTEASFWGFLSPGRVGELTKIAMLKHANVPLEPAFVSVLIDRVCDLIAVLALAAFGIIYLGVFSSFDASWILVLLGAFLLFAGAAAVFRKTGPSLSRIASESIDRLRARYFTDHQWKGSGVSVKHILSVASLPMSIYSVLVHLGFVLQVYLTAYAFGIEIDIVFIASAYGLASAVALLPISVGGFGTREATYILLLSRAGVTPEAAAVFSVVEGVIALISTAAIFALGMWIPSVVFRGRRLRGRGTTSG